MAGPMSAPALRTLRALSFAALVAGGANWGLAGLAGLDLVALLLGEDSLAARQAYILIGLAAVVASFPARRLGLEAGSTPRPCGRGTPPGGRLGERKRAG